MSPLNAFAIAFVSAIASSVIVGLLLTDFFKRKLRTMRLEIEALKEKIWYLKFYETEYRKWVLSEKEQATDSFIQKKVNGQ